MGLTGQAGLRYNRTESFPVGVYRAVSKHPEKGDLVTFQPPTVPVFDLARKRGYIERAECMLKRLVALGSDVVTIDGASVTVNGRKLPNSVPRQEDLAGRPMPVCRLQATGSSLARSWSCRTTRPSASTATTSGRFPAHVFRQSFVRSGLGKDYAQLHLPGRRRLRGNPLGVFGVPGFRMTARFTSSSFTTCAGFMTRKRRR